MIDNDTHTVYIPWHEGDKLVERLCNGECSRSLYRQLGHFSVQIYHDAFSDSCLMPVRSMLANESNGLDNRSAVLM